MTEKMFEDIPFIDIEYYLGWEEDDELDDINLKSVYGHDDCQCGEGDCNYCKHTSV